MNKNKAKELSDILLAYSQGKVIQFESINGWVDIKEFSSGDLNQASMCIRGKYAKLRIKPEPKLVPFTFEDNKLFKDKWIKYKGLSKDLNRIVRVCSEWICIENLKTPILYESLLDIFEFEDNSPCGKYINE